MRGQAPQACHWVVWQSSEGGASHGQRGHLDERCGAFSWRKCPGGNRAVQMGSQRQHGTESRPRNQESWVPAQFCHQDCGSSSWGLSSFSFLIDFLETVKGQREQEMSICCFTHSRAHWLFLGCALPGDGAYNLSVLGRCSNQLSYPARPGLQSPSLLNGKMGQRIFTGLSNRTVLGPQSGTQHLEPWQSCPQARDGPQLHAECQAACLECRVGKDCRRLRAPQKRTRDWLVVSSWAQAAKW